MHILTAVVFADEEARGCYVAQYEINVNPDRRIEMAIEDKAKESAVEGRTKETKIVKTICNMCLTRCGIDVYVENGEIVKVRGMQEHPYNRLCEKGYAIPELVHSPDRSHPPRWYRGVASRDRIPLHVPDLAFRRPW